MCHDALKYNNMFLYSQVKVLWSADEINTVIKDAHEGSGESTQSKSLQSHIGITSLIWELSVQFYWRTYLLGLSMLLVFCSSFFYMKLEYRG